MQIVTGSYTGNGVDDRWINDAGFQPDLVIIKGDTSQNAVFSTSAMSAGDTGYFANAASMFTNGIQAFGASGFQIGTSATVNSNGVDYYWAAFRDNGVGDFTVGTYAGNSADNHDITGLGFDPDIVWIKSDTTYAAMWNIPETTSGDTLHFTSTANQTWRIELITDGFRVDNYAIVNNSGIDYYYVAFKNVAGYVDTGTYTGNGVDDRNITDPGFEPDLVFVKGDLADHGVLSVDTMDAGDSAIFSTAAPTTNLIQALNVNGFQIGTNARVNQTDINYYWAVWKVGTTATTTTTTTTTSSSSSSSQSVSCVTSTVSSSVSYSMTVPPILTNCVDPVKTQQETIQLIVPSADGTYELFDMTDLTIVEAGLGAAPSHLITQRGVNQDGFTVVGHRLDPRTIIVSFGNDGTSRNVLWGKRRELLDLVNVGRSFDDIGTVTPYVYRKTMPGGDYKWRNDLVTTAGSDVVTSLAGRFAHWGLEVGSLFTIVDGSDAGDYTVLDVTNENTLVVDTVMTTTGTNIAYEIWTGPIVRDLDVVIDQAPSLPDDKRTWSSGYVDTLRLVTQREPVWYNPLEQRLEVTIADEDNLIFYATPGYEDRAVFPIWFGSDDVLVTYDITYIGTWPSRPVLVATGPFSYIELESLTTGAKAGLLYDAATGETVTLDIHAQKAYNNLGASLTRFITEESNMSAMYLYPKATVLDGINSLRITMTSGTIDVSTAVVYWNARYNGI